MRFVILLLCLIGTGVTAGESPLATIEKQLAGVEDWGFDSLEPVLAEPNNSAARALYVKVMKYFSLHLSDENLRKFLVDCVEQTFVAHRWQGTVVDYATRIYPITLRYLPEGGDQRHALVWEWLFLSYLPRGLKRDLLRELPKLRGMPPQQREFLQFAVANSGLDLANYVEAHQTIDRDRPPPKRRSWLWFGLSVGTCATLVGGAAYLAFR